MQLYYSPMACSLAAHIACREGELPVDLVRVDLSTKRAEGRGTVLSVNPMGQVPALVTDEGRILTENVAVLSYLGDKVAGKDDEGAESERYERVRWIGFVGAELHKAVLWQIFSPTSPDPVKDLARLRADRPLSVLSARLESRSALLGDTFGAPDAYLFWALVVCPVAGVSLERHPVLQRYVDRHRSRPGVAAALDFELSVRKQPFAA
ncbi:MAG TPA: glutathione S-transferase N-terminal domain-containing protein [Polyangiaceae bacterium]|nr:glutathione S-transferase N-terminal domain-containing protein [Polyangiaceae bacterium]